MKKITLTESDLLNIVNKVLNEQEPRQLQKDRQFDEDEIDLLNLIFERELKPPFTVGEKDEHGLYPFYNRNNDYIGWLISADIFLIERRPFWLDIKDKVCRVFEFSTHNDIWWSTIKPHLIFWMEDQLNIELLGIR